MPMHDWTPVSATIYHQGPQIPDDLTVWRHALSRPETGTDGQGGIAPGGELESREKRTEVRQGTKYVINHYDR
jgi:hypothetical protein